MLDAVISSCRPGGYSDVAGTDDVATTTCKVDDSELLRWHSLK